MSHSAIIDSRVRAGLHGGSALRPCREALAATPVANLMPAAKVQAAAPRRAAITCGAAVSGWLWKSGGMIFCLLKPFLKTKSGLVMRIAAAGLLGVIPAVQATVVVTGKWTLDDPESLFGSTIITALDSAGSRNLYEYNISVARYSTDVPLPGVTEIPISSVAPSAPTYSASFTATGGSSAYLAPSPAATYDYSDKFGVEVWVKSGQASQSGTILFNGNAGGTKGWGFIQDGTNYKAYLGGVGSLGSAPVSTTGWTHLAIVRDKAAFGTFGGGGTRFYVNGILNATQSWWLGFNATAGTNDGSIFSIGSRASAQNPFTGLVAEARVFTFNSGAFSASDLNVTPKPATGLGRAAWMQGKYGVFIHYFPGIADITGSNDGQIDGYYCMPNQTYESLTGQTGFASHRNLLSDIYDSLQKVNPEIKVMAYLASEGPRAAPSAISGPGGLNCANGPGPMRADFRKKFNKIVKEWSQSMGSKLSGWWFDGCWSYWDITYDSNGNHVYNNPPDGSRGLDNLNALITACRSGNPNAAVACNTFMLPSGPDGYTTQADYTTGEANFFDRTPIHPTVPVTDANGSSSLHWNLTSFLGKWWANAGTTANAAPYPTQQLANYVYFVCQTGGSLMIDVEPSRSGSLAPAHLAQLMAVNTAVRVNQTYTDYTFLNNGVEVTNVAAYKPSWFMSNYGDYELPVNGGSCLMSYGNDLSLASHATDPALPTYEADGRNYALAGGEWDWNYRVDLGGTKAFNYYVLTQPTNGYATAYAIEGSANGTNWNILLSATATAGGCRHGYLDVDGNYRYARVRAITPNGANQPGVQMAIQEFELYQLSRPTTNEVAINVPYHSEQLYAAYNSEAQNLNQIGTYGVPSGSGNKLTAIAGPGYIGGDYWADYRTTWQFKLDELGINAADVTSATLKWTAGQILWPSSNLAIDVVDSILMYGGANIASGLTTFQEGYSHSGSIDITTLFKTKLGNATSNSGLALQFYFVGPTGGTSPYQGGILNTVSIDVTTDLSYRSAPPTRVAVNMVNNGGVKNLVLTGSGGVGSLGYSIESSTNLIDWNTIAIRQPFGLGGTVNFTNVVSPATRTLFYRIRVP
jgi:Concanavalin A-like lectin/glucanases superfamily